MCHECDRLKQRIRQFERVLTPSLTTERLAAAVVEMEAKKIAFHPTRD
jgi:hypothetical protein